jgi:hypothetical protein
MWGSSHKRRRRGEGEEKEKRGKFVISSSPFLLFPSSKLR